jgi:hypothetical protein
VSGIPDSALAPRDWARYAETLQEEADWVESLGCGTKRAFSNDILQTHIGAYRSAQLASDVRAPERIEIEGEWVDPHLVRAAMVLDSHGGDIMDRDVFDDLEALRDQLGEHLPVGDVCTPMPE